jgi:riboflavin kinase/FMN adenylyltransferase
VRDRGGAPTWPAVASLGTNPTFVEDGGLVLEVHVLDFDADLYDQRVRVEFVARLRDEARYDSVAALLAQIDRRHRDARAAQRLAEATCPSAASLTLGCSWRKSMQRSGRSVM